MPTINADVSCGTLTEADTIYTLTTDVNSNGTCFTIEANNVTLDCKGFRIRYSKLTAGYAVNNSYGYNMTTVRNCKIIQQYSVNAESYGIYHNGGNG